MGITWKTMPLLSTLAALVIIVHSAEEDFEPDYRDVRPRRFDTVNTNYEQPWRIQDMEPVATQSTQVDWGLSSQEEAPKRRRLGRKRKRRPPTTSEEDLIPQERHVYQEEYRPYQHEKLNTQAGTIRRRRKQFDSKQSEIPNTWTDETVNADRPLIRKRGNKRKRPLVEETWPEFSEFNGFRPNDNTEKYIDNAYNIEPTESTRNEYNSHKDNSEEMNLYNDNTAIKTVSHEKHLDKYENDQADVTDISNNEKDEDKSLSQVSLEIPSPSDDTINTHEKSSEKAVNAHDDTEKAKNNVTLDPQTLKEILKKSNGRSLSEILQQHNLSLVDLLHGKEKAISILTKDSPRNESEVLDGKFNTHSRISNETNGQSSDNIQVSKPNKRYRNRNVEQKAKESVRNTVVIKNIFENDNVKEYVSITTVKPVEYTVGESLHDTVGTSKPLSGNQDSSEISETTTKLSLRRRFPIGSRRKLRMRPMNNTTYKSQLNRDLIALTSRRYQLSRNSTRPREWKDVMPTLVKIHRKVEPKVNNEKDFVKETTTTTFIPDEITLQPTSEETKIYTLPDFTEPEPGTTNTESDMLELTQTITTIDLATTEDIPTTTITITSTDPTTTTTTTTTEKPTEKPILRPVLKASDLRRQAFNNRLKRKRLKQKITTTESAQENAMKDIFGMANLVSASEFIAKVQPRTTSSDEELDFTTLEDFITTESTPKYQTKLKSPKTTATTHSTRQPTTHSTVQDIEETAKIEIEEILNDTLTNARLSKILMERNMTINELVEHRERGSSHIHLADIFHNASREPNPPEPFLSKSLLEPISKETYPLRALLEANLHDPTAKATPLESNSTHSNGINIPVVMDFGNNVNENGENMGIMSLFDNFTKITEIGADLKVPRGQPVESSSHSPEDNSNYKYDTSRESRTLNAVKDLVSWKEIFEIMHRGQINDTDEVEELTTKEISPALVLKKIVLEELDDNDDSMIVVNDLHHHNDFHNHISSDDNIEHHLREQVEHPSTHRTSKNTSNSAKSVTVATASIIGLAMVLFLLTYVAFRWKQQRSLFRDKETLRRNRIPTPVFENRKGHKINSSTRSKSPMISSTSIYTIDTSDMRNGNDSPEYMWESLRKPFQ